eukprot:m.130824 g.130824  ORF g.130824 m.130824 type:complete len:1136 (-) comp29504_c1_seq1:372-3779(-)
MSSISPDTVSRTSSRQLRRLSLKVVDMLPSALRAPLRFPRNERKVARLTLLLAVMVGIFLGATIRTNVMLSDQSDSENRHRRDEIAGVWGDLKESTVWIGKAGKIPPFIHQIWDDEVVENSCQISAQSWEWFCDVYGCKYHLWRREDLTHLTPFVNRKHYLETESPQMRADIARLEILSKHGGLYLDCDMIWAGRSKASDGFVDMLSSSELAVASSNDIRNATGRDKSVDLAIVFFTNRVLGSAPNQAVIDRTIQIARGKLEEFRRMKRSAVRAEQNLGPRKGKNGTNTNNLNNNTNNNRNNNNNNIAKPKAKPFHMTGPYVLNLALQEAGDSTPVQVIPSKWVYPESLEESDTLVMFGHHKDRAVHSAGLALSGSWGSKPWLMQRGLPNFFTKAQDQDHRVQPEEYLVHPTLNSSNPTGAIAVFLHHNKAGGTAVKVALQQLFNITTNLTRADAFSKSACAYSKAAISRAFQSTETPDFCDSPEWASLKLPACGRCKAPALVSLIDNVKDPTQETIHIADVAPNGWTDEKGKQKCQEFKDKNKCKIPILKGKCCDTCGYLSCPEVYEGVASKFEVTPSGASGGEAAVICSNFKAQGMCTDPRLQGFCCETCGAESCSAPNMVVGDYSMGLCNVLPSSRPCAYYTMLREPRKRIASSYLHCQYEPDDQLCMSHVLDAREASFEQWVAHQGNYLFRQLTFDLQQSLSTEEQYEMYIQFEKHRALREQMGANGAWLRKTQQETLAEEDNTDDFVARTLRFKPNMLWLLEQNREFPINEHDAISVIDLLEYHFAVIGLVERFDESLEMFEAVFGLPFPDAISKKSQEQTEQQLHVHEGEDLGRRRQIQNDYMDEFKNNPKLDSYIAIDLALYEKAKVLFEDQHAVLEQMRRSAMGVEIAEPVEPDERSWLQSIADETVTLLKKTKQIMVNDESMFKGGRMEALFPSTVGIVDQTEEEEQASVDGIQQQQQQRYLQQHEEEQEGQQQQQQQRAARITETQVVPKGNVLRKPPLNPAQDQPAVVEEEDKVEEEELGLEDADAEYEPIDNARQTETETATETEANEEKEAEGAYEEPQGGEDEIGAEYEPIENARQIETETFSDFSEDGVANQDEEAVALALEKRTLHDLSVRKNRKKRED